MKKILTTTYLLLSFLSAFAYVPISVCSWNLENFGKSKSDTTAKSGETDHPRPI